MKIILASVFPTSSSLTTCWGIRCKDCSIIEKDWQYQQMIQKLEASNLW